MLRMTSAAGWSPASRWCSQLKTGTLGRQMVYIVLTAEGLNDLLQSSLEPCVLWINADVASNDRIARLREAGWNVTVWTKRVDFSDRLQWAYELATIREHHPGQMIWMEQIQ